MRNISYIIVLGLLLVAPLAADAVTPGENISQTVANIYDELLQTQRSVDDELRMLQQSRDEYWQEVGKLQNNVDKALLVLSAQDGGNLFSIGQASEELHNVCSDFSDEKAPFENWLRAMDTAANRHANIRKALRRVHTEHLSSADVERVGASIAICDSLDRAFAAMRDSIAVDRQRYLRLEAEIAELEGINGEVVTGVRAQLFQDNDDDFLKLLGSFNYFDQDTYYLESSMVDKVSDAVDEEMRLWNSVISVIAIVLAIGCGVGLRWLPKKSEYRSKRWYIALLAFLAVRIAGEYLMWMCVDAPDTVRRNAYVSVDYWWFLFWMILSALLRLKRPGLGWSMACYLPLMVLSNILIALAVAMTRTLILKMVMVVLFVPIAVWALVVLAIGCRRVLKADYFAAFGSVCVVLVSTALVLMGYYYPSFMLVLYCVSVMTYLSALACFKRFFAARIQRGGAILRLTLGNLVYPYFYIYTLLVSLYYVADVFNLNTWLTNQISTPFVSLPQFGIISVSRLLFLVVLGILVNYLIRLVKHLLMRADKDRYTTGARAVGVTLGTMLVWFAYALTALLVLHINHSGVIAAVGGASLGLGFAMKDTFENLTYGLQLMSSRARPGDLVECDGARGVIRHIGILSTQVQLEDGPIVSFPNRQLGGRTFTNLSLNHRREIRHIVFDIAADSDLELAKRLMLEASRDIDGVVDHDKHYVVMRNTVSGIVRLDYKCWIDSARYLRAEPAVREAIFRAFRANGIKIADISMKISLNGANSPLLDNR